MLADRCHVAALRHPPRDRFVSTAEDAGFADLDALDWKATARRNIVTLKRGTKVWRASSPVLLRPIGMYALVVAVQPPSLEELEAEVRANGFDRVLHCPSGVALSDIVQEKLEHPRHTELVRTM